jgi:hypothetical protein
MVPCHEVGAEGGMEDFRSIYGFAEPLAPGSQMPDVVEVIVGDEHGVNGIESQPYSREVPFEMTQAYSRIDHKAEGPGSDSVRNVLEQAAIACAAAGNTDETKLPRHLFSSFSQYFEMTL